MQSITQKVPTGPGNVRAGVYFFLVSWVLVYSFWATTYFFVSDVIPWWFPFDVAASFTLAIALHYVWLRHVVRGRTVAVVLAYIAYVPSLCGGFTACAVVIVFFLGPLILPMFERIGPIGRLLVAAVVFLFAVFLLLLNIFCPGLRPWLKLNGYCPSCGKWRFERGKPGTTEECEVCGAQLTFEWAE